MKRLRRFSIGRLLAIALVTSWMFVALANAQSGYQGKFTLSSQVHWGSSALPPGNYSFKLACSSEDCSATIWDKDGKVRTARTVVREDNKDPKAGSALLIATRGGENIVHTVRLAGSPVIFIYDLGLAHQRGVQQLTNTNTLLVNAK
jgi:hypothetical protein